MTNPPDTALPAHLLAPEPDICRNCGCINPDNNHNPEDTR